MIAAPRPPGEAQDLEDCPCTGRTLSKLLHPAVLSLLAAGPQHGYRIVEELSTSPVLDGKPPDSTGVYRLLRSMEAGGYLHGSWQSPTAGPARRSYRLTPRGARCLSRWVDTLEEYHRSVGRLLRTTRRAHELLAGEAPPPGAAR